MEPDRPVAVVLAALHDGWASYDESPPHIKAAIDSERCLPVNDTRALLTKVLREGFDRPRPAGLERGWWRATRHELPVRRIA